MNVQEVTFHNRGVTLAGTLKLPDGGGAVPAVVQGPGWLGLRSAKLYEPYHEALLAAGIAVFVFDYRGFGESGGSAAYLDPMAQVDDWMAANSYLETRPEIDPARIGAFGSGGTGGGNAVVVGGLDRRVKAVVSQVPIADGRDWLRRMRREHEWLEFLAEVAEDRRRRTVSGESVLVAVRERIMVPTPERRTTTVKSDVDGRVPVEVELASADAIMAYRPVDFVERIAPRAVMFICVERDATTPEDHAFAMFERAGAPKRLVVQTGTTHYAAYAQYRDVVNPLIVEWFQRYLVAGEVIVEQRLADDGILRLSRQADPLPAVTA